MSGQQVASFFGVPEYVVFPTILTGPVACKKGIEEGSAGYPFFDRTLAQVAADMDAARRVAAVPTHCPQLPAARCPPCGTPPTHHVHLH
eukprot:6055980-Prymnesium_polylepis.1